MNQQKKKPLDPPKDEKVAPPPKPAEDSTSTTGSDQDDEETTESGADGMTEDEFIEVMGEKFRRRRPEALPPPEVLAEEMKQHPFFMKEAPSPGQPLPPLLDALQQIKYSPEANGPLELAKQYKNDGLFQYKLEKYRLAASHYKEALAHAEKIVEEEGGETSPYAVSELKSTIRNNWGMCEYHLENYRQALIQFRAALALRPWYEKSLKKAVDCCRQLGEWHEGYKWINKGMEFGNPGLEEELGRKKLELQKAEKKQQLREAQEEKRLYDLNRARIILKFKVLHTRGIKCQNPEFLTDEKNQGVDAVVKLSKEVEDRLLWPVLFYYPEGSQSDFIEEFDETEEFLPHLKKMFDEERPAWDKNQDYSSSTVRLYFVDSQNGNWVEVEKNRKLKDALKMENYMLPSNGVPGFFILADNEFCKFFLERSS